MRNLQRCDCLQKFSKYEKTTKTYRLGSNGHAEGLAAVCKTYFESESGNEVNLLLEHQNAWFLHLVKFLLHFSCFTSGFTHFVYNNFCSLCTALYPSLLHGVKWL